MSEWRDQIIRRFVPNLARVTAVSDPDGLLRDPGVFQGIQAKGFSIVQFEDSISFRYDYETRFRSKWDAGAEAELVVVFKPEDRDFETLPADVLANAQRLSFTLRDIFPKLSYSVVSQLETIYFDALYLAQQQYASQPQDEAQTRGFVLRHVFGIEPTVIKSVPDLLRMLCQRHYSKLSIPAMLDAHLISALRNNCIFSGWPLETIVPNRSAFWAFLNERWPIFVGRTKGGTTALREENFSLKFPGPELLPFDHDDIRIYIDNLFEDGLLTPIDWDWNQAADKTWIRVGLRGSKTENTDLRFEELRKGILQQCPTRTARPQDWLAFAYRYAQANILWNRISASARARYQDQFPRLRNEINQTFFDWLLSQYGALYNYPATSPLMVHHIPANIAHHLAKDPSRRAAFVLVDGMAIDQWLVLKESLNSTGIRSIIEENALFAWIPTITPISRQAAFSGIIPRYFSETLDRTNQDEVRWRQFWSDRGMSAEKVGFILVDGDPSDLESIKDKLTNKTRIIGITLSKVDKIVHGAQLGSSGVYAQLRTWADQGFPLALIDVLRTRGFDVFVSADHGNTEALGIGRPKEGVLSDTRGERCRIYSDPMLRKQCVVDFAEARLWDHAGLPENIAPLIADYGKAFTKEGANILCHGGAALEEVCVPLIRIPAQI